LNNKAGSSHINIIKGESLQLLFAIKHLLVIKFTAVN